MKKIDPLTGEVIEFEPQGPGHINSAKTKLNYSRETEKVYTEIPAFAVDAKTGEILNKTNTPTFAEAGEVNVQEKIQSFKDSCDIYKILEKFYLSGDESLLQQRVGTFGDFIDIPDNINDFDAYVKQKIQEVQGLDADLQEAVSDGQITSAELEKLIDKYVTAKLIQQTQTTTEVTDNE